MRLLGIPALDHKVMAVALTLRLVYSCDNDAASLIFFIMESSEFTPTGRASYHTLSSKLQFFRGYWKNDSHFGFNLDKYKFKALYPSFTYSVSYILAYFSVLETSATPPGWFFVASSCAIVT